ncbi:hypothetical protein [Tropicibacter naphthalenivorans]|uniref:hypothetical protein n=1 Tax=Tropicibacter naphthalenivorans TaxID=441103 RepID=UPI00117E985E|nr:hypothetical protein [Tropicibacter naphthalenivorans]
MDAEHDQHFYTVSARSLSDAWRGDWYLCAFDGIAEPQLARYLLPGIMQANANRAGLAYHALPRGQLGALCCRSVII